MKIVFISYHSGIVYRGAETFCDNLASNLAAKNEVTLFQSKLFDEPKKYNTVVISGNYKKNIKKSFLKYLGLDYYNRHIILFTLKSLLKIAQIKPDIIIPVNGRWMSLIIKLYTFFSHTKMVISGQAGLGLDEKWNLFLRPDLFVSLSSRNDKWVKKYFPNQKTVIIPNGVNLEQFQPSDKTNPFKLTRPIILTVAGPEKYKNVKKTIKAVWNLNKIFLKEEIENKPKASLIIVGGSQETKELSLELLNDNFKQIKIDHNKIPEIYNCADLFTLVSETGEAFGISYLEALACNLPVVATDDDLRHEIIDKAGLYFDNINTSKDYAKILKKALKTNWGNLPRLQAQKFDWNQIASSYHKAFSEILETKSN